MTETLATPEPLPNRKITVNFDGSCLGNPGPGGFAAILQDETSGKEVTISGPCGRHTTNNKAELTAALKPLLKIKAGAHVTMTGDSEYVIKGMSERIARWKRNGWRTSSGGFVANVEEWKALEAAASKHAKVNWVWQHGHAGCPLNEKVDGLARAEAEKLRRSIR
ncbi:ribonuclease H [Bosea vestrisii]|uniref:ribonuclease H family protein n=1 Tax=Bosea vestrisii TaxID=151416 RepID=UPI0024E00067|nr:ribonuclease H [Bosea vestrisii]WID97528.1 ribonuclease H [Bosea vestrisii]